MATAETPTSILFSTLKQLKINNKDAARVLLSSTQTYGDKLLKDRIDERTFLHRLTRGELGFRSPSHYSDLAQAAQVLCSRIVRSGGSVSNMSQLVEYLMGEPLEEMALACRAEGLDGSLFTNLVSNVRAHSDLSDTDKAAAILLAYIGVGCLGDPVKATELVEGFLASITTRGFRTGLPDDSNYSAKTPARDDKIALVRVIDGSLDLNNMHVLSTDPEGNVIGSMSTDAHSINDVGPMVSKRHLRVFCDQDGSWFVQGLGSTNGTTLIDGADKHEVVVELPKAASGGASPNPVPLHVGDALHLAGTTVFLAIKVV